MTASAAEPSAADAWFQRKMALHETARRVSAKARQAEAVAEQKRRERSEEATLRVDRELEWNRARVSALRARLETAIAPIRAARDARDPTSKLKAPPKPVFVSYARDAPFAERALVRAIVDAVNSIQIKSDPTRMKSKTLCWHDDDDVPLSEYRDWKHVQVRRVDAAFKCDVFVVIGSPSYERSETCALERAATRVRREPPEWGGDGAAVAVVAVDAAEACGFGAEAYPNTNSREDSKKKERFKSWRSDVHAASDVVVSTTAEEIGVDTNVSREKLKIRTRAFEDVIASRVAAAVVEKLREVNSDACGDMVTTNGHMEGDAFVSNVSARVSAVKEALDDLRATSSYQNARQKKRGGESDDDASSSTLSDPPHRWSAGRVAAWLRSLGGWTAPFAERFEEEKVHGSILDALDADTLRERFGAYDKRVRGALLDAVTSRFATKRTPLSYHDDDDDVAAVVSTDSMGMSHVSRLKLASLRAAIALSLTKKSRGAASVSEDDAFDALFEAATEVYRAKETEDDTPSRERIYDACLLACCDAHESRSSLGLESRVDAARFAEAAAETLHGEMDDEAATSRRRATAELDAIETLSMVDHEDHEGQNDHKDHVTPLILRAALETKLRARGVDARGVGDENEKTKSGVNKKSGVFFPVVEAKRAVDDVVADGLLAGSGAAGARAAARFFEVSEERRGVDECVADMVRVAFARRAKSRVDAAVAAAAARAAAAASARAAITLRRDAFETSRLSAARARALDAYAARLRVALETVAATAEPVSAFRGAVSLVETFAATSALVDGFPSRQGLDASMTFFDADDPEDRASETSLGVYAGVLVPGARASSRALRVVHASLRSRRKTGSEMRAWEGNAWPSVGIARTEGPLAVVAESTSPSSFLAPRVVDADDELVVPVFASVSRKTSTDRSHDDASRGDDFDGLAAFERFERFDAVYRRGFTKEEEAGFLSEFPDPDVSETPAGFLALEFGFGKEEIINEETARRRRSVVLLAARAAGVALSRFSRNLRLDREALRRGARDAFEADEAEREAVRSKTLEALEERRRDAVRAA